MMYGSLGNRPSKADEETVFGTRQRWDIARVHDGRIEEAENAPQERRQNSKRWLDLLRRDVHVHVETHPFSFLPNATKVKAKRLANLQQYPSQCMSYSEL